MTNKQRPVYYVCHPVRPTADEIAKHDSDLCLDNPRAEATRANLWRAARWLSWLRRSWPDVTFVAPWLANLAFEVDDDNDPAQRELGLVDCETVVPLCTGVVLVGGRVGTGGQRERAAARNVVDMLHLGTEPPKHGYVDADWRWVS